MISVATSTPAAPGREGRDKLAFEDRVGGILLLFCLAAMAGIAYWYPWYLCTYHSAPDDRYGFAMIYALPFWFIGPALAGRALFRLMRAVSRAQHTFANSLFAAVGVLLALVAFSPVVMFSWSILFRR
jgi:hypothetical protein